MNATDIRRVTIADLEHPASQRAELAAKASEKLGYHLPGPVGAELAKALIALEIFPLKTSMVEKYQRSKEKATMWSGYKLGLWELVGTLACTVIFSKCLAWIPKLTGYPTLNVMSHTAIVISCVSGVILFIFGWGNLLVRDQRGSRKVWRWERISLEKYSRVVPDFVLYKAIQITEAIPGVSFQVDYLSVVEYKQEIRRDPDPFLLVTFKGESYYIDVWDEREYELTV